MWLCLHPMLCLILHLSHVICKLNQPFEVVWNVPSYMCEHKYEIKMNLEKYKITANVNQTFDGDIMVLFYETLPGLYPKYIENGSAVNGGLPQNVPLEKHFNKVPKDVNSYIKNNNFSGLAVIDWESWKPIFNRNEYDLSKHIYMKKSEILVHQKHPSWNESLVKKEAAEEFEAAARDLMQGTLLEGRRLRANGLWGFYGFPRCFNYRFGQNYCANDTMEYNNQLRWMWAASSALYPSIYLQSRIPVQDRVFKVQGILNETIRVQRLFAPKIPAFAYSTFRYTDTHEYYSTEDLKNTIGQSFDAGFDGVVLWDSSQSFKTESLCMTAKKYLDSLLGSFIKFVIDYAKLCSLKLCNGHGKCVRENWYINNTLFSQMKQGYISFNNYKCRCFQNWTGAKCNKHL